jgi:tetratricopeptide (TPR) repeat protein
MSRKKDATTAQLSDEEHNQVQSLFAEYHQLAQNLHKSTNQQEAENALGKFNALSEPGQTALLKMLGKENDVEAADVLVAINALNPHKEVRKEARRALLRLEAARITAQWTPPITLVSAIEVKVPYPPRFWKGWATQTREEGVLRLVLCWEQGYDYSEARLFTFQLDFWQDGIKECFDEIDSKRHIDQHMEDIRADLREIALIDCNLATGKRLLEEALSVNEWRHTRPDQNYRNNLPVLNKLIFQATDLGTDSGQTFINPELEPQEVALNFIGAWSMGDFGLAADLLISNSIQREGLTRDEWIARRRAWADESHPTRLELSSVHEREQSQSSIWLPSSSSASLRKEIELGWSLELNDTPLSGTLKEMPMGTAVNKDTGRHWFWTNYTLVREHNTWRIQSISDEGAHAQGFPIVELQKRIKELEDAIESRVNQRDLDRETLVEELSWRLTQLLHYYDALIALLPFDYQINEQAYTRSIVAANPERTQVYLDRLVQRFPNNRAEGLRRLGATLTTEAYKYDDLPELQPRQRHLLARAETALQQAIDLDASALSYTLLAELYLSQGRNDDAEALLLKAREARPGKDEEAMIESALGNIAMRRERIQDAIPHFQRVAELEPGFPGIWFNLGFAYRLLSNFEQAETSYSRAIQAEPSDIRPYSELIAIAMNRGNKQKARDIAEQGVKANPDSASLHALLASVLQEIGDLRGAEKQLAEAEAIDPDQEIVQSVRESLRTAKRK